MKAKRLNLRHIWYITLGCAGLCHATFGAQAPNPRAGNTTPVNVVATSDTTDSTSARAGRVVVRAGTGTTAQTPVSARSGARVETATTSRVGRSTATTGATSTVSRAASSTVSSARTATNTVSTSALSRSSIRQKVANALNRISRSAMPSGATSVAGVSRAASSANVARGAATTTSSGRSATNKSYISRSGVSRATEVFDDVSKIGGGYSECRDAYNTCMDQFCAKANEDVKRCYCSSRYTTIRQDKENIEAALGMLQSFATKNLESVTLTAGEVNAMYTATEGENAVKNDPSAAAKLLGEIDDLLSGKKSSSTSGSGNSLSLGVMDFDLGGGLDADSLWSGGSSGGSLFGGSSATDLSTLEGVKLYNAASESCLEVVKETCSGPILNMVRSSYNILITQSCNDFEKIVDKGRTNMEQKVREMDKALRDERLKEYRAHNSADVNECLEKVRTAITQDAVCGENFKKCLDDTGGYVDAQGQAIPSPKLLNLTTLISLYDADGMGDILQKNQRFNAFLDDKRKFATSALDTCRDDADMVWTEFKRTAMIEIAQAQDNLIEKVKSTCISTITECYDKNSNSLKDLATSGRDSTASGRTKRDSDSRTDALARYVTANTCAERVTTCASLYSDGNSAACQFDANGKWDGKECGLSSLLSFVDTVNEINISDSCKDVVEDWLTDRCTPSGTAPKGQDVYPWGCKNVPYEDLLVELDDVFAKYCKNPDKKAEEAGAFASVVGVIDSIRSDLESELYNIQEEMCSEVGGEWLDYEDTKKTLVSKTDAQKDEAFLADFYANFTKRPKASDVSTPKLIESLAGANETNPTQDRNQYLGFCMLSDVSWSCKMINEDAATMGMATYIPETNTCKLSDAWFELKCISMQGTWVPGDSNAACYVKETTK